MSAGRKKNLRTALAGLLALCLLGGGAVALRADEQPKVDDLADTLAHAKTEKSRIGAVVALGRMRDARALRPLAHALTDDSNVVRALAATALGYLGDPTALPALQRATSDADATVRRRATEAIATIKSSHSTQTAAATPASPSGAHMPDRLTNYAIAPQESPRFGTQPGQVYVVLKSAQDKSAGDLGGNKSRELRAKSMRTMLADELRQNQKVTLMSSAAPLVATPGVEPYAIDISIMKLERHEAGPFIEVECELRVAVSDTRGKMLSFLTGGAKVQVPKRTFRQQYEPELRNEALQNAVRSVHQDLVAYLSNRPS